MNLSHYHDERLRRCGNRAHGRGSQQNWGTRAEQHGKPDEQLKSGERGRNRTYNLLIKSYGPRFGCGATNCSRHNHLTIKKTRMDGFRKRWKS